MDAWLRSLVAEGVVDAAAARAALEAVGVPDGQPRVGGPPVATEALAELVAAEPLRARALARALAASGAPGGELEARLEPWLRERAELPARARRLLVEGPAGTLAASWLDALLERLDALAVAVRIAAADLEEGLRPDPPGTVAVIQLLGGERELLLGLAADAAALGAIAGRMTGEAGIDAVELGADALRELVNIAVGRTAMALAGELGRLRPEPPRAAPLPAVARDDGVSVRITLLTSVAPVEALAWLP